MINFYNFLILFNINRNNINFNLCVYEWEVCEVIGVGARCMLHWFQAIAYFKSNITQL